MTVQSGLPDHGVGIAVARLTRDAARSRQLSRATLWIGLIVVVGVAALSLAAPFLNLAAPDASDYGAALRPPSFAHLFGTDNVGRDIFSRVVFGAQIDLLVGVVTTYIPLLIGLAAGAIAGYFGGWWEAIIMRLVDTVIAFPFIVLVLAIVAIVGPGLLGVYIGLIVVGWALYARLTYSEMLVLRERQFILAAKTLGFSDARVIVRHALPNLLRPNLVFSMSDVVLNILILASLSYLGVGVQPPTAEWGAQIAAGQTFLLTAWWISTLPGLVIVFVGVGFSLIGDGLADRLSIDSVPHA